MADEVERWPAPVAWLYALFSRDPRSNREVVDTAKPTTGDIVVDIGCGSGAAVRRAAQAGAQAIGVDSSSAMVDVARRFSRRVDGTRFEVGHAADLPLPDDHASLVWAIATFHHWPDGDTGLAEAQRILRPGGRLLVGERLVGRWGGHGLTTSKAEAVARQLQELGFVDVGIQTHRLRLVKMLIIRGTLADRVAPRKPSHAGQ